MHKRKHIVGIMGGAACSSEESALAERVGELLAEAGVAILCGGGSGIMEAAARGAKRAAGFTIGIMPGSSAYESPPNQYIDLPIFTGMSDARNSLNVKSSAVIIAIAGGPGTLSEIGLALKNGKTVIALKSWEIYRNGHIPDNFIKVESAQEAVRLALDLIKTLEIGD